MLQHGAACSAGEVASAAKVVSREGRVRKALIAAAAESRGFGGM